MKSKCLAQILLIIVGLSLAHQNVWAGEDIDDIETDMETAISESDAAQSEAADAKKRQNQEAVRLEKARAEAAKARDRAKAREASAKAEIKAIVKQTEATKKERIKFEAEKAATEKKIQVIEEKVAKARGELEKVQAERDAARNEREAQQKILADKVKEQSELVNAIIKDREESTHLITEIDELKKKHVALEKELIKLRENARKEADKREKLEGEKAVAKRAVSNVPTKVVVRRLKYDCEITDAAGDGAQVVGKLKKGTRAELYRVSNKRWFEIQNGKVHGFAAKTCF